jgi:3-deoxy-D-manno-octulosonic-acid transferase
MALPLGLRLYLLAQGRAAAAPWQPDAPRPDGPVVWLDAPDPRAMARLGVLARLMLDQGLADGVVLTGPVPLPGWTCSAPPADRPEAAAAFLDHWRPDLGVLAGGALRPILMHEAGLRGIPLILVEGDTPALAAGGWWPGIVARALSGLAQCMVIDEAAARAFRKAGAATDSVRVAGLLEEPSHHLPGNEAERAALARILGTRPVWLAADVPEAEDDAVAAAHLVALRMAHRLLLILAPDDPARAQALAARLVRDYGLDVALRSVEDDPRDEVQVYVADIPGEMGLWFRLATTTFLGGTLSGAASGCHPYAAAAQGSALIHGVLTRFEGPAFARLRQAGASRVIGAPADLGEAVGDLLAPDRAARLAQAAWAVATSGREATQAVCDLARGLLAPADRPAA